MQEQIAPARSSRPERDDNIRVSPEPPQAAVPAVRTFVSLIAPAYNEAAIIQTNLEVLCSYMRSLQSRYDWEIVVINDGSKDETGWLAEEFARGQSQVHVVHHRINKGLGQALRTGFSQCQGDYIVVVDLDLSYATEHIGRMLDRIEQTQGQIVLASPYMKGGSIANVPWLREKLSIWANRFLSAASKQNLATLTGMVRAYDARFLKSLSLRASGMDINPEVINKALLLHAHVEEIPGHLHWHVQPPPEKSKSQTPKKTAQQRRRSSMRLLHHTWDILFSGFLLRPVMFFVLPSLAFFGIGVYASIWVLIHCWTNYQKLAQHTPFPSPTDAVAQAFSQAPHTFFIGGMATMLGVQLLSLGILSAQNKSYYEELFCLGTTLYRQTQEKQTQDRSNNS